MMGTTKRQADALRFVSGHIEALGRSPGFETIKAGLGLWCKSSVYRLLTVLAERGHISRGELRWGAVRPIEVHSNVPIPRDPDGCPLYFVEVAG